MSDLDNELTEVEEFSEETQVEETPSQETTETQEVQTDPAPSPPEAQPVPPSPVEIPDSVITRFRDKSPEEIMRSYAELEKMHGEHARQLDLERRQRLLYETYLQGLSQQGSQQVQKTAPSQADKGPEEDLDAIFFDKPTSVIEKVARKVIRESEEHQRQAQLQQQQRYYLQLQAHDTAASQAIKYEDPTYNENRERELAKIVATDPAMNQRYWSALTSQDPQKVAEVYRELNQKAKATEEESLKKQIKHAFPDLDPEILKQFRSAQKQAAGASLGDTANSQGLNQGVNLEELAKMGPEFADIAEQYRLLGIKS